MNSSFYRYFLLFTELWSIDERKQNNNKSNVSLNLHENDDYTKHGVLEKTKKKCPVLHTRDCFSMGNSPFTRVGISEMVLWVYKL